MTFSTILVAPPVLQSTVNRFMLRFPRRRWLWSVVCKFCRHFAVGLDRHTYEHASLVQTFGPLIRDHVKMGTNIRVLESASWISSGFEDVNLDFVEMVADWLVRGANVELKLLYPTTNAITDLHNAIHAVVGRRGWAQTAVMPRLVIKPVESLDIQFADGKTKTHERSSHFCLVTNRNGSAWEWVESGHHDSNLAGTPNAYAAIAEFIPYKSIPDLRLAAYDIIWEGLK